MSGLVFLGQKLKIDALEVRAEETGNQTSFDFTNVNLGNSPGGMLLICAGVTGSSNNVSSVSVNGNAATSVVSQGSIGRGIAIYRITGESGIGTVTVDSGNNSTRWLLGVLLIRGVGSQTPHATDSTNSATVSFNVPAMGAAVACAFTDGNASAHTYSSLTKMLEVQVGSGGGLTNFSVAALDFKTAQTPHTETLTATFSNVRRFIGASWS